VRAEPDTTSRRAVQAPWPPGDTEPEGGAVPVAVISREEKKKLAQRVGKDLTKRHGQKKFYSVREIGDALRRLDERVDLHCWAYCFFSNATDFAFYHASRGEACDYAAMKADMLDAVSNGASGSWFDPDLSWLDWPDFDFSGLFDFLDWS
jgi:hypothetical protein